MAAMIYTQIESKKKIDWQTVVIRNKEDRMEYPKINILNNFSFFRQNVGVGLVHDAHKAN